MNETATSLSSPIPLSQFEASAQGGARSLFFPPEAYTSEAFYRFERLAVWMKEWIAVGRVEEIPADGDYFSITIAGEPIVVVRSEREILAFSAVCRHRGMLLVQGSGNCKGRFVCPYHRWTYDRRGKLIGAPEMQGVETFKKEQLSLPSLRVDIWCGIVFVNFDDKAAPLSSRLAPLDPYVANWHIEDLKSEGTIDASYRTTFDYAWNWKIYAEGQSECYHCDKLHSDTPTMAALDFKSLTAELIDSTRGVFTFLHAREVYRQHTESCWTGDISCDTDPHRTRPVDLPIGRDCAERIHAVDARQRHSPVLDRHRRANHAGEAAPPVSVCHTGSAGFSRASRRGKSGRALVRRAGRRCVPWRPGRPELRLCASRPYI